MSGKILEQDICNRFRATQTKKVQSSNINEIQSKLVRGAEDLTLLWKNERLYEQQVDQIVQSLTLDKRLQR